MYALPSGAQVLSTASAKAIVFTLFALVVGVQLYFLHLSRSAGTPSISTAGSRAALPAGESTVMVRSHDPPGGQELWNQSDSAHKLIHDLGEKTHSAEYLSKHATLYSRLRLNFSREWAADQLDLVRHRSLNASERVRRQQCIGWHETYGVVADERWGFLPPQLHAQFENLDCSQVVSEYVVAQFVLEHPEWYDRVREVDAERVIPQPDAPLTHKDTIAIIVTMNEYADSMRCVYRKGLLIEQLVLFTELLPSLVNTVERGFEYWFYFGYDRGDRVFDQPALRDQITTWFAANVTQKAWSEHQVRIKLVWSSSANPWGKPGPALNYACAQAFADGAEWIYRINDDQTFQTPWANAMTETLREMGPPYGVVGLSHPRGAQMILVVDFVHRTHHDIFTVHYPPGLMKYWMDNWSSLVYGRQRTRRLPNVKIQHFLCPHGSRTPEQSFAQYFRGELLRTRLMMELYLAFRPGMEKQLQDYREHSGKFTV